MHGDEFFVGFEVVVLWEYAGAYEFFLQYLDEVEEVFRTVVADVVYCVWWYWQTVFTRLLFWGVLHDSYYTFYDVVDVGEVTLAVAVVEDLYLVAFHEFVGEAEVCHVWATGRTVDGEEAEAGRRDIIELAVCMCHQLVALLGGCIEAYRIVHLVVCRVGHFLVAAIDA